MFSQEPNGQVTVMFGAEYLMFFLVLGHVQPDECLFEVFVQVLCHLFGSFSLSDATGAEEQKHQWMLLIIPAILFPSDR